jgi:hypothetical protein
MGAPGCKNLTPAKMVDESHSVKYRVVLLSLIY